MGREGNKFFQNGDGIPDQGNSYFILSNGMGNDLIVDFPAGCWLKPYTQPLQRFTSHLGSSLKNLCGIKPNSGYMDHVCPG